MLSSMFCQLWKELRQHPQEKLRITYTHPMDDGQSRTFKVRFEGEGVDDYGGPYREIFQQICDELQAADPGLIGGHSARPSSWSSSPGAGSGTVNNASASSSGSGSGSGPEKTPVRCFLPLLRPSSNWTAGECAERYKYVFNPASSSALRMDLYRFLGQLVGLAVRSKITIDLALPSIVWKYVVREQLTEADIASFDIAAFNFVTHLASLHKRLQQKRSRRLGRESSDGTGGAGRAGGGTTASHDNSYLWGAEDSMGMNYDEAEDSEYSLETEIQDIIQDLNWTASVCGFSEGSDKDGAGPEVIELVPGGVTRPVTLDNLGEYLRLYVEARLTESAASSEAFRGGLVSVIPESALLLLTWDELEKVVCGARVIDVERLREATEYDDDISATDPHILLFWEVLREFSEAEKSAFLRFVWARPTLPPVGVDFPQKMKVQSSVGEDSNTKPDQYLPKAHTCFFSINLPKYSTKELMASKLRYAITQCTEMDADYRLTDTEVAGWSSLPGTASISNTGAGD